MKYEKTLNELALFLGLWWIIGVLMGKLIGLVVSFFITWTVIEYYKWKKKES